MCDTWKKGSHLEESQLEKWITYKSVSHFKNWDTFGKTGHNSKNGPHLKEYLTLGKMNHIYKSTSQNWDIFEKKGHTSKHG